MSMEWISVSLKLPEYSKKCLVAAVKSYGTGDAKHTVEIADRRFTNKDGDHWMNDRDDLKYWTVTHWMSLPESPK